MLFIKKIVVGITLLCIALFWSNTANAVDNPCYKTLAGGTPACAQYAYDSVEVYFRDEYNAEQKVLIHRVRQRVDGKLVHANYDFEVQCYSQVNCANTDALSTSVLWAFRNALVENRLYTIGYTLCDPREEICCDDNGLCSEILGDDEPSVSTQDVTATKVPKVKKKRELSFGEADGATNLMRKAADAAQNGADFMQEVTPLTSEPIKFFYTEINTGSYQLCAVDESRGSCDRVPGRIYSTPESFYAEFSHSQGSPFNDLLYHYISKFKHEKLLVCNVEMKCESNVCSVVMRCR